MNVPFLDLKRQYAKLQEEIEPKMIECLRSTMYVNGPYVAALEKELSEYTGAKHSITCANGTDALILALRACNVQSGDEVITSPFSFFATAEAIASIGAIPVFVDIQEDTFNIDPSKIEQAITAKTKAIMPVHIFGQPAAMDEIMAVAKKHKLRVIEDAAQGIGATYKGKNVGNIGDITCFSFYPTKNLGAYGDAGMVCTNDDELACITRALKEHGAGKNGALAKSYLTGETLEIQSQESGSALYDPFKYYNYLIGYNSRLDAMQAVILSVKLPHLDAYNKARAEIAERYNENLKNCITPIISQDVTSCWHQYAIRTSKKDELLQFLSEEHIGAGAFYPVPLHLQKAFENLGYKEGSMPIAEKISSESVCLPIFPELTIEEQEYVIAKINAFLEA